MSRHGTIISTTTLFEQNGAKPSLASLLTPVNEVRSNSTSLQNSRRAHSQFPTARLTVVKRERRTLPFRRSGDISVQTGPGQKHLQEENFALPRFPPLLLARLLEKLLPKHKSI